MEDRKCSSTASVATCLPWLPWQQQSRQSNWVLESSNAETVNGAIGRCDGTTGSCRETVRVCVYVTEVCTCVSIESGWTKGRLEHAVLLYLICSHRQENDQISDAAFPSVSAVTSITDLLYQCCHVVPLQCSGWWPSESWEEGQRSVWVCLCNEHSHRVLLPHPGERCVCLWRCMRLFFSVFYTFTPFSYVKYYWDQDSHSAVKHWLCLYVTCLCVFVCLSSRLSLPVNCSVPG